MLNTYEDAVALLKENEKAGIKPGLERIEFLLEKIGNPERHIKTIHIAGTNGKGSTLQFIRSILQENGYEVGTFTSPYFYKYNEQIQLNGKEISDQDFVTVMNDLKPVIDSMKDENCGGPTAFEIMVAVTLLYYRRYQYVDIVLFETGLGGTNDSTNILHPLISIITNVGHDHMNMLGDTIEQIASEKAGIIKSGVPVISGVESPEALKVIEKKVSEKRTKLYLLGKEFVTYSHESNDEGEQFNFTSPFSELSEVLITMKGDHQVQNAALALMTIDFLNRYYSIILEEKDIINGLKKTSWMGRFEEVSDKPLIILDGAHNPEGIESLVQTVKTRFTDKKYYVRILFSALKDKQIEEMTNQLSEVAFRITYTTFDFPRAESATTLFEASKFTNKHFRKDWKEAIEEETAGMKENEVLIVCGSLYFISAVREYLSGR